MTIHISSVALVLGATSSSGASRYAAKPTYFQPADCGVTLTISLPSRLALISRLMQPPSFLSWCKSISLRHSREGVGRAHRTCPTYGDFCCSTNDSERVHRLAANRATRANADNLFPRTHSSAPRPDP